MRRTIEEQSLIKQINDTNDYIFKNKNSDEIGFDELIKLTLENIDLSESLNYYEGLAKTYRLLGIAYKTTGLANKAIEAYQKSENLIIKHDLPEVYMAELYNSFSILYDDLIGDLGKAIKYIKKGIEIVKKLKMNELHARFVLNLGVIYGKSGLLDDSLDSYNFALDYYKNIDYKYIFYCYSNIGNLYIMRNNYEKAYPYLKKAYSLSMEQNDSVVIADSIKGLTKIDFKKGKREEACTLLKDTIIKLHADNFILLEIELSFELLNFYIEMNEFNDANELLSSLEKLIQSINKKQFILTLHQLKAKLYELQGDFKKAFYSYKKYKEEQEKINIEETRNELDTITSENMRNAINRLNVIADIGKDITSNLDVEKTAYAVYQHVNSLMKANIFGIAHLDKDELCYDLFIENNEKMPVTNIKLSDNNSFGAWCINNDKEVIINDVEREYSKYVGKTLVLASNQNEDQNKNKLQSLMYVPLKFENKIVGIISVQSYDKDTYLIEDFETLKILATYVAIALKNARQSQELKILSTVDGLTNLYNRRYLNTQLNLMCKKSRDENKKIGLMIIDIDFFKKVNDVYGHPAGDICLKQISYMLTEFFEEFAEIVARIGGEEFAVLLYDRDVNHILTHAEKLRKAIEELEIRVENKVIKVTISIGISVMNETTDAVRETIFRTADEALYVSKNSGRNQVNIHSVS